MSYKNFIYSIIIFSLYSTYTIPQNINEVVETIYQNSIINAQKFNEVYHITEHGPVLQYKQKSSKKTFEDKVLFFHTICSQSQPHELKKY